MTKKIEDKYNTSEVLYDVDLTKYYDDEDDFEVVFDDLKEYLDYCISQIDSYIYVVHGSIGGWSGRVEGYMLKHVNNCNNILWYISDSEEPHHVTILNNGVIELLTRHHDGSNSYTFKPLCNLSCRELRSFISTEDKEYLREQGFKYLRTKAELLEALNELID